MQGNSQNNPQKTTNPFPIYFNWAFCIGLCPFRFVQETSTTFRVSKFYPQLAFSALVCILYIIVTIGQNRLFYEYLSMQGQTSPLFYFRVVTILFGFIFQLLFFKRLWFNHTEYLEIVNFIQRTSFILSKNIVIFQSRFIVHLICLSFLLIGLYDPVLKLIPPSVLTIRNTLWTSKTVSLSRYTFFMVNFAESQRTLDPDEITSFDCVLTVAYALGWLSSFILFMFHSLLHLFAVGTVWLACFTFSKYLRDDLRQTNCYNKNADGENFKQIGVSLNWDTVYKAYKKIRELCYYTNEAFGTLFTMYLANCIVAQAAGLDAALVALDYNQKIQLSLIVGLSILTFLLAADACDKVGTLKLWLAKDTNRENIPTDQLNVIMAELHNREVGIRGSNICTITYPALWNIMSTVITYFIICVQARQQQ